MKRTVDFEHVIRLGIVWDGSTSHNEGCADCEEDGTVHSERAFSMAEGSRRRVLNLGQGSWKALGMHTVDSAAAGAGVLKAVPALLLLLLVHGPWVRERRGYVHLSRSNTGAHGSPEPLRREAYVVALD